MKISIITVCYNSIATLKDAMDSVLSQTYSHIEYIIIDGGSCDGTLELIEQYSKENNNIIYVSEPDCGIYDAMNKGIAMASGDIIGILNSDDFYTSNDCLESVINTFKKQPEMDMVFGAVDYVKADNIHQVVRRYPSKGFKPWHLYYGMMPPHPASFVKKHIYDNYGVYRTDYKIAADFEFFIRTLLKFRCKYLILDEYLVRMRQGGVSTAGLNSVRCITREIALAFRQNDLRYFYPFFYVRLIVKLLRKKWI